MAVETETENRWYDVLMGVDLTRFLDQYTRVGVSPYIRYRRNEYDYDAMARSLTYTDSFMEADQQVDANRVGVGLGFHLDYDFGGPPDRGAYVSQTLNVGVDYVWAEADSTQRIHVPVNPNPADRRFTVEQHDEDEFAALNVGLQLGVGYRYPNWSLELYGSVDWTSGVAGVDNPSSPNDDPFRLDRTNQATYAFGINATYLF